MAWQSTHGMIIAVGFEWKLAQTSTEVSFHDVDATRLEV